MMNLTVVVLVDQQVLIPGSRRFAADEPDRHVAEALRTFVKRVEVHPYTSVPEFAKMIEEMAPSLIFNLTEHGDGDRRKDSHICALMDLNGVPYTGTGPAGMILCRDKALSKLIAAREGFRVPAFFTASAGALRLPRNVTFPMVVKPRFGDGSDGIHQNSLVGSSKALRQRLAAAGRSREDAVICEEYVRGRDILVTIAGKRLMPAREYVVGSTAPEAPRLASYRLKHDKEYRRRWKVRMVFAQLTSEQQRRLERAALRTFDALEMRDYGRLDLRLTPSGEWVFLEANPNPPIVPFDKSFSGSWAGVDHREIVKEIVQRALRRKH